MAATFTGTNGPSRARALAVDGPGDELLAGPALAHDQHGHRRAGHRLDELVESLRLRGAAHQLVGVLLARQLGPEVDDLAAECPLLQRPADERQDLVFLEGLGDVVERPELHRRHRRAHRLDRGDEDDLHVLVEGLQLSEHVDAVRVGQPDVEEDDVHLGRAERLQRPGAVGGLEHLVVVVQDQAEGLAQPGVVVHDQDDGANAAVSLGGVESHLAGPRGADGRTLCPAGGACQGRTSWPPNWEIGRAGASGAGRGGARAPPPPRGEGGREQPGPDDPPPPRSQHPLQEGETRGISPAAKGERGQPGIEGRPAVVVRAHGGPHSS